MNYPRRRRGTGTIEPMRDGTFRPRMPGNGERLSPRKTYEEAETLLNAAMLELAEGHMVEPGTETLRGFGLDFLDDRESAGVADVGTDRSRWKQHIEAAHFIDWPLGSVAPHDVREWPSSVSRKFVARGFRHKKASRRKLSRTTVQNTLNLLRCCFTAAVEAGHIETNPAREVAVPDGPGRTHEPWTYLEPKEQEALLECESIPEAVRLLIAFAVGTGMRQGEIWNLETRDVCMSENRVIVRYGSRGRSTKGKRIRYVPLFGIAREALERWLKLLPKQKNPLKLAWPLPSGARRQTGKAPKGWPQYLVAAKIIAAKRHDARPVRWHDLRHTCASSLISGWWGRKWSLEEVQKLLGHRSRVTTERYAHLTAGALEAAARETDLPTIAPQRSRADSTTSENHGAPPRRLERPTNGLGNLSQVELLREVKRLRGVILESSRQATEALVALAADEHAWRPAIRVLAAIAQREAEESIPARPSTTREKA